MPDYSLYLVTDRNLSLGRTTVEIVRAAARIFLSTADIS